VKARHFFKFQFLSTMKLYFEITRYPPTVNTNSINFSISSYNINFIKLSNVVHNLEFETLKLKGSEKREDYRNWQITREVGNEFQLETLLATREAGREECLRQKRETKLGSHKIKQQ